MAVNANSEVNERALTRATLCALLRRPAHRSAYHAVNLSAFMVADEQDSAEPACECVDLAR